MAKMSENKIKIDWQKVGLLPVVIQDNTTGEVLMMAYMNEEALNLTFSTGFAHYFSRSKNRIWKKVKAAAIHKKFALLFWIVIMILCF